MGMGGKGPGGPGGPGKGNHFETVISIHEDKTDEVFAKLQATNNAYFRENIDLVALSFKKN